AAAQQEIATTQQYFSLLNGVRQRNALRPLGWTWAGLDDLRSAALLQTVSRNGAELRTEAATCLGGIDVREKSVLTTGITSGALPVSPDGRYRAIGQFKADAQIACSVVLLDLEGREPHRVFSFWLLPLWQQNRTVQDGVRALAFSPDGRWLAAGLRG